MITAANKVIWFEGMFLQPQHFQQHDRYLESLIHQKSNAVDKNIWGFSELTLDLSLLSIGKLGIASCRGIFPDGTPFHMPPSDQLPIPYEIEEGTSNTLLYLALPLKEHCAADTGTKDNADLYRYHAIDFDIKDNIAGSHQMSKLQLGTLACKILSEHDDLTGYSVLPIGRIEEARANHQITLDQKFVPTCLDINITSSLKNLITEIHGLLNHRAEMLAGRLTDTQAAGTAEIVDFMLLQLVNKYGPLFHYLMNKSPLHPEALYTILIKLMGEMATFTNDKRRPIEPPVYQHEDLYNTFQPVIKDLRNALSMVLEQNATAIKLESRQLGTWVGQIHDKELVKNCNFVLAVYADLPTENVRNAFPAQVKIAPVEQIRTLVSRQLPGIDISPIAVAPRQIPYHANFSYFSINTKHPLWEKLENSAGIAFHAGSHFPGLKLELWAIRG